jgi:alpha-ketoglutarate-dependent 2,4-dichlorophenoxyacetate dioxygenase
MAITIRPLHPQFCAEIDDVDTGEPMDDATFAESVAAFEEHSVLVFHDQSLDDARQIAFSRRFGPLEMARKANPATGTLFARQSNLDIATGAVIPPEDRRMVYQKGNYLWHSAVRSSRYHRSAHCCPRASFLRWAATPNSRRCARRMTRCRTI